MKIAVVLILAFFVTLAAGVLPCPCCEAMSAPAAPCGEKAPSSPATADETSAPPCHGDPASSPAPVSAPDPCGCDHLLTAVDVHLDLSPAAPAVSPFDGGVPAPAEADLPGSSVDPFVAAALQFPSPAVGPPSAFALPLRI